MRYSFCRPDELIWTNDELRNLWESAGGSVWRRLAQVAAYAFAQGETHALTAHVPACRKGRDLARAAAHADAKAYHEAKRAEWAAREQNLTSELDYARSQIAELRAALDTGLSRR